MPSSTPNASEIVNPHDPTAEPERHAAWQEGFEAGDAGRPVSEKHRTGSSSQSNAWLNGYTAAQLVPLSEDVRPEKTSPPEQRGRVYIVDDHPAIRRAVAEAIENTPDLEMAGQARSLDPGVDEIEAIEPDVAIIDISLPDGHGLDLIQALRARAPDVATVVFSMYDEAVYAERAIRNGALSYVMKTQPVSRLLDAIRSARRGQVDLSQQMTGRILKTIGGGRRPDFPLDELSDRELEVFQMIGQGLSLPAIQERLCLSRKTVETHRRGAKEKLGLDSVSELIQHAMRWVHGRGRGEQLTELGRPPGAVAG